MELTTISERLFFKDARILFYRIVYPVGISERADRYYTEGAEAFAASCKNGLYELALEDYINDRNPRKKYRHKQWEAAFVCEVVQEVEQFRVILEVTVDGEHRLLRREFADVWEKGVQFLVQ